MPKTGSVERRRRSTALVQTIFTVATKGCADRTGGQSRFGQEANPGAGLDHVGQVTLRVCGDQDDRGQCLTVDVVKRLGDIEALVDFAREGSDTIAERMRALDAVPDGRSDTVVATTSLPRFPADVHNTTEVVERITTRIYATVDTLRTVHDAVDAEDPSTADILHEHIDGLEKLAWLIKSENRKV
jgi:hypothetical protein